jgi:hypothetical protein
MIDMEIARRSLLAAAKLGADKARQMLEEEGQPKVDEAISLIVAATNALDVASRVITSVNWIKERVEAADAAEPVT